MENTGFGEALTHDSGTEVVSIIAVRLMRPDLGSRSTGVEWWLEALQRLQAPVQAFAPQRLKAALLGCEKLAESYPCCVSYEPGYVPTTMRIGSS